MQEAKKRIGLAIGFLIAIGIGGEAWATPTTKVLLTDPDKNRVIEVDGTKTLLWEFSTRLNKPYEAIPLTNGDILIADRNNNRIVEVTPDKTIKTSLNSLIGSNFGTFTPLDVRRCVNWLGGPYYGTDTLLIVDSYKNRVIECTYPGGNVIWEYSNLDLLNLREAEKRPGSGTPTYLIANQTEGGAVTVVERTGPTSGSSIWTYSCNSPKDASWTPCDNVLIVAGNEVIEVEPKGSFQSYPDGIVGTISTSLFTGINEAIRMHNGNILVAGYIYGYPGTATVVEFETMTNRPVWEYATETIYMGQGFADVELKGIMNVAKILYEKEGGGSTQTTLCGIIVPILQPIIENPFIIATKTVFNQKPEYTVNDVIEYQIKYTNTGPGTATNVTIIDQIPEGTEYILNSAGTETLSAIITYSNQYPYNWTVNQTPPVTYIKWTIDTIGPNVTGTVKFKVKVQ